MTTETAKHRVFQFLDASVVADHDHIIIALEDAFWLGVLSSRVHLVWARAAGGTLEDRPRYNKRACFDPFPFPACDSSEKTVIRELGEELDSQRGRAVQAGQTITAVYNVMEKLRRGVPLRNEDRRIHDEGKRSEAAAASRRAG